MAVARVAVGRDYPQMIDDIDHAEPAPRRVRATLGGELIFDSTQAPYVWEWAYYPQYYIRLRTSTSGSSWTRGTSSASAHLVELMLAGPSENLATDGVFRDSLAAPDLSCCAAA